jgi:hypothetical protein
VAKTATYSRAYAEDNGFLTLLSDGERLTGAYALGTEAGEWMQQATWPSVPRASRVLIDVIQPFPTFSEIYADALKALAREVSVARESVRSPPPAMAPERRAPTARPREGRVSPPSSPGWRASRRASSASPGRGAP